MLMIQGLMLKNGT